MTTDDRPGGDWVAIQRNRQSGAGRQYRAVRDLIVHLKRIGIRPRLFSRRDNLDAAVADADWKPPVAIVAAGGDGTVLDILNRHPEIPVAILPLGTENLIARHYAIPHRNGRFVAQMIAAGRQATIDLGLVGHRRFAIMVSCGFDSTVLARAHADRSGNITRRHYVQPIVASLRKYRYPEVRVYVDDQLEPLVGGMVIVGNLPRYAFSLPLVPQAAPQNGRLAVRVFRHRSMFQLLSDLGNVLLRRGRSWPGCIDASALRVRIESSEVVPVQADGDPAGETPVDIEVLPRAARLIVP